MVEIGASLTVIRGFRLRANQRPAGRNLLNNNFLQPLQSISRALDIGRANRSPSTLSTNPHPNDTTFKSSALNFISLTSTRSVTRLPEDSIPSRAWMMDTVFEFIEDAAVESASMRLMLTA